MHERRLKEDDEEILPALTARVCDDGGLPGDWMETAENIADAEERIALRWRNPMSRSFPVRDGRDHLEPGFVLLGSRKSLAFIGETVSGITEHGEVFAAWARHVRGDPKELQRFADAYLGRWESVEAFIGQVLDELPPVITAGADGDHQLGVLTNAVELADELQRRGDICAIDNPEGGVWIFRGARDQSKRPQARKQKGGEHA
jgi:hypothetical protein